MNELGAEILTNAKVTLVFTGYGFLTLTEKALIWNKTASSYIAFGIANAITADHLFLPLEHISKVEKYTYFPGGGIIVTNNEGKTYKIAFKHKNDFSTVYDYLTRHIK